MVAAPHVGDAVASTSGPRGARRPSDRLVPYAVALAAVLPLLAPAVWSGVRLAPPDPLLAVIAPSEAALSIRGPAGVWAVGLALGWFGLACRSGDVRAWEVALVLLGGAAALVRVGNTWLDALAMLAPLGRQVRLARVPGRLQAGLPVVCVATAVLLVLLGKPVELPSPAGQAALADAGRGHVLAEWRWAPTLQRQLGPARPVLAAGGLTSESSEFWLDYLRVSQGHATWPSILRRRDVDLLVLDAADQQRALASLVRADPGWQVLLDADGALVARRTGP